MLCVVVFIIVPVRSSEWNASEIVGRGLLNAPSMESVALAGLIVSGHKAIDSTFVQQSACAALTLISSARTLGDFNGDVIVMTGPLGSKSPHDAASWRDAPNGWVVQHSVHAAELTTLLDNDATRTRVLDLVPILLRNEYPFMRRNLNFMKLAVYTLDTYDKILFVDLDIVIIRPLFDVLALSIESIELVGYRTCTAPVNSGFFVVRPKGANGKQRLKDLNEITVRNKCPCQSTKEPFASSGFDNRGTITLDLKRLWEGGVYDAPNRPRHTKVCQSVLEKMDRTWDLAGAGTGQGLMWYYYGLKIKSYVSLTYVDLPLVHYNAPGPKPWSANAQKADSDPSERQHCDFVWWRNFLELEASLPEAAFDVCVNLLSPHLAKKRAADHFAVPACCRTCPGGGHFVSAQTCTKTSGLAKYAAQECKAAAELDRPL